MRAVVLAFLLVGCAGQVDPTTYTRTARAEPSDDGMAVAVARCDAGDELVSAECDERRVRYSEPADEIDGFGPDWSCGGYRSLSVTVTCARR